MPTLRQRFRAVEAALEGPGRYLDLRLDLVAQGEGEAILTAGAKWDKTLGRFLDPSVELSVDQVVCIPLQESQLEFARWYAEWLCAFREGYPRDVTVAMMASDRRAGKSFIAVAAVIACCIDVPVTRDGTPLISWIVAKSFRERFELEQWIIQRIPKGWYRHLGAPVHEFHFIHGPTLRVISADDDDNTKQGRCDVAFINEPQKMGPRAVANAVLGCSDLGGLCILAANPPGGTGRGEWMFDLKEAIDDDSFAAKKGEKREPLGIRYFHLDSRKNQAIDQLARRRAGHIAAIIDPTLRAGDVEGEWRRQQQLACWEFDKRRHLHAVPAVAPSLRDVTREIIRARAAWGDQSYVAGVDFDSKPHIIAIVYRVFDDVDDPLFWAVDEFAGEKLWTTQQWIEAFADWGTPRGYTRESLMFVGDASSSWPGNRRDPKVEEGRTSFEVIEGAKWTIVPPQDPRGDTGRARNPLVKERLDLYNDHLLRDRVRIDPAKCMWLVECHRKAETKRADGGRVRLVHNKYAHAIDAATYPIWRLAPLPNTGGRGTADDARFVRPRRPATW